MKPVAYVFVQKRTFQEDVKKNDFFTIGCKKNIESGS